MSARVAGELSAEIDGAMKSATFQKLLASNAHLSRNVAGSP